MPACIRDSDRDRALMNVQPDKNIRFHYRFLSSLPISSAYELPRTPGQRGNGHLIYLFVGSQTGGKAAAVAYTLIETAKLNGVDPQAWLADTIARIPDYKITRVDELLPWQWPT